MGYSVQYPAGNGNKYAESNKKQSSGAFLVMGCIVVVVLFVIVSCCIPDIRRAILPGDPAVTEQAIQTMIENLKEGQGMKNCFAEFCREVISAGRTSIS